MRGLATMKLTKTQREELKQKYDGHCAYCGSVLGDKWHADHIEAVDRVLAFCPKRGIKSTSEMHKPHLDTIENLNPSCVPCNINKHSMSLESWRKSIAHYRDVQLLRDSGTARHLHRFGLLEIKQDPVVFYFEQVK